MTLTSGRLGRDFIVELQFTGRTAQSECVCGGGGGQFICERAVAMHL